MTGENRNYRRETCFGATYSITYPMLNDLALNSRLRGERPASNRHSMAWSNPNVTEYWEKKITFLHLLDKCYPKIIVLEEVCINCTNGVGTAILLISLKEEVYS